MGNKRKLLEIGTRFGSLTVIERAPNAKNGSTMYLCECDCGNTGIYYAWSLRNGESVRCNNCRGRKLVEPSTRFGNLVMLERAPNNNVGKTMYKCKCDCGNIRICNVTPLTAGKLTGCKDCGKKNQGGDCRFTRELIEPSTRFGSLVVLERAPDAKNKATMYLCRCYCGNVTVVSNSHLKAGQQHCKKCQGLSRGESGFNILFARYKKSAKTRGLSFKLTKDQFVKLVTSDCAYCGAPPSAVSRAGSEWGAFVYNGIDRMKNDLGYTPDNVVPCCKMCNFAKVKIPYDDWIEWLDRVVKFRSKTILRRKK